LRQEFTEIHNAHDRSDIRQGDVVDRTLQITHFIGCIGGIDYLVEQHTI
jgi:hypothetical protein